MDAAHELKAIRIDAGAVRLGATPIEVRPDGYKVYRGTATYGDVVLEYPEYGRNEFRPAAEVLSPGAVASMIGVPFTLHHPDDLLDASDEAALRLHQVGTVLAARVNGAVRPPALEVEVIVHGRSAQEAVESGRLAELSPGYRCHDEAAAAGAAFAGKPYHIVQRGHRYNHLSGVLSARTVLPDGRRARLDEMPPREPAYPPRENATMDETTTNITTTRAVTDVDPAAVLAKFSPEDAVILQTLSPEGLATLAKMGVIAEGEAAEVEAIEEGAGEAGVIADPPTAITMDMVTSAINDAIAKMGKKADAAATASAATSRGASARVDADAIIARAAEAARVSVRTDAALVDAVRRDGHDVTGYDDAVTAMLAVVERHAPKLLVRAREDLRAGRMDEVRAAYGTAEDHRREAMLDAQASALRPILDAAGDGQRLTGGFRMPARSAT